MQPSSKRFVEANEAERSLDRFRSEADIVPLAREWLLDALSGGPDHWLVVDEHLVGTRIPDLLAARVDLKALRARTRAEQWEPLTESELVALASLRRDRPTSVHTVATHIGFTPDATRR